MKRLFSVLITFIALMLVPANVASADISLPLPTVTLTVPRLVTVTAKVPGPTVTLPRSTVTLPRVTDVVTLPRVTVTQPPVVRTSTVTITQGGAPTVVRSGHTMTQRDTMSSTPPQTVTKTPAPVTKEKVVDHEVRVSVPEAVGISIGLVLAGLLLGLLLLYIVYRTGYAEGEHVNRKFLAEMRTILHRR